jgi:hypothetical protein
MKERARKTTSNFVFQLLSWLKLVSLVIGFYSLRFFLARKVVASFLVILSFLWLLPVATISQL